MNNGVNLSCKFCEEWPNARTWRLRLACRSVSQNELQGNYRGASGWKYRAIRARFEREVSRGGSSVPRAETFRRVTIIRHYRKGRRQYDFANLVGGAKPLIDSLVKVGLLVDDNPKWCFTRFDQVPSGTTKDWTEVVIEENRSSEPETT